MVRLLVSLSLVLALAACNRGGGRPKTDLAAARVTTIGVNSYLWSASLETLAFMPIAQVDSNGGVILTDWQINPKTPGERLKVTVRILDAELRADALQVAVNRQTIGNQGWVEAVVRPGTVQKLEETILTRARDLRRAAVGG